ncbi:LuxR C-terminal-related transcriptional regulator [Bacteroidales bacterium OttesenSCG-928-I14]|nr:LuxR C-terminal-related transcriptional regulator [Bacteroidales bacterium OttesenSCG-928-I14]
MKGLFLNISILFLIPILSFSQDRNEYFSELESKVEEFSFLEREKTFDLIEEMYSIASDSPDSINLLARTFYSEALLRERQGMDNEHLIEKVHQLLTNEKAQGKDKVILNSVFKQNYLSQGNYTEVFTISLEILDQAKQLNDSLWVARTLNTLGIISMKADLFNLSEEYFQSALDWAKSSSDKFIYFNIKSNLLYLYLKNSTPENVQSLLDPIELFLDTLSQEKKDGILMINYLNTSNYWHSTDKPEKVLEYLTKAQNLSVNNSFYEAFISSNIGLYHLYQNDLDSSMPYFKKAQYALESFNNLESLSIIYRNISRVFELQNKPDSALYYINRSEELTGLNKGRLYITDILRGYMLTSLEASENKLALAQLEIDGKDKQVIITLLATVTLFLIIVIIIFFFIQERRRSKQNILLKEAEAKELSIRLDKEQALQKIQAEQLESKLRELTSYSLLLNKKNEVLREINHVARKLPPSEKEIMNEIKKIVDDNIQTENDWNDFMLHFEKVHPQFFEKIKKTVPEITPTEMKLVAYIRLGISTKQIAQLTNVAPQSVKMSRHRLRQKIGLNSEDNLDTFILNI